MMSKNVLVAACLVAFVALVSASGLNPGYQGVNLHEPRIFQDNPDWLGNKNDGYSVGYSEKHFQIFTHILTYVKYQEDADSKHFLDLYKFFIKSVWDLKRQSTPWGYQENYEKIFYGEVHAQQRIENWNNICDEIEGSDKEVKTKRLFMVYLKFRTHYFEQRKIERTMTGQVVEKTRKQFSIFLELVAYAEKAHYVKKEFKEFCQYAEVKLKVQYSYFKKCVFNSYCVKWESLRVSAYKKVQTYSPHYNIDGYHDRDNYQHVKAGDRFALFNKAQRYARMISDKHYYDNDHDAYIDWNYDDEDEYHKDKHPIIAFFIDLHSYLSKYGPRDFWTGKGHDDNEARLKFLFFTVRAYRQIQVLKIQRERKSHSQERFGHFSNFLDHHEDGPRTLRDFGKFQTWHGVEENQRQLANFEVFLKNLAVVKGYPLGYGTGYGGHHSPFGIRHKAGYGGYVTPLGYGNGLGYGRYFGSLGHGNGKGHAGYFGPSGYGNVKRYGSYFGSLGYGSGYEHGGYLSPAYGKGVGFGGLAVLVGYGGKNGVGGHYGPSGYGSRNGYGGYFGPLGYGKGYRGYFVPLGSGNGKGHGGYFGPHGNGFGGHFLAQGPSRKFGYRGPYTSSLAFRKHNDDGELYRDEEEIKEEYYKRIYNRLMFYEPHHKNDDNKRW